MQTTKTRLVERKKVLEKLLSEAARKGASLVMRGRYKSAAAIGEDMEPLVEELEKVNSTLDEAADVEKTVARGSQQRVGMREIAREAKMRLAWKEWWENARTTHTDEWSCRMAFQAGFAAGTPAARKKAHTVVFSDRPEKARSQGGKPSESQ